MAVSTLEAKQTLSKIDAMEQILYDTLQEQDLEKEQISLLAMHLTEIEQEAERYRDLLRSVRLVQTSENPDRLLDILTEVLISLYHLGPHTQEAEPLLEEALGLFEPEDEET